MKQSLFKVDHGSSDGPLRSAHHDVRKEVREVTPAVQPPPQHNLLSWEVVHHLTNQIGTGHATGLARGCREHCLTLIRSCKPIRVLQKNRL